MLGLRLEVMSIFENRLVFLFASCGIVGYPAIRDLVTLLEVVGHSALLLGSHFGFG